MNQRKIILYIAASLDGYIATEEHSLDWLFSAEGKNDNGFSKFYDTVDTFLIGRATYDWIMNAEKGNFPYKGKECYVFSRMPKCNNEYVTFVNEDVITFTKNLKNNDGKNIWVVGGGELLHAFIKGQLVDELWITIAPVLLGKGIPLFKPTDNQTSLLLRKITQFNQFVELQYDVIR